MPTPDDTSGDSTFPRDPWTAAATHAGAPPPGRERGTTVPFSALAASTVIHVSKLSAEAIALCDLRDVEYVVIEPAQFGWRLRPAEIEDQLKHEQEAGLGRVTYSLGEFLDEFTNAPNNPAPTFDRLAQFKRDYAKLTPPQREQFRAAVKKFVAPFSTTPPGDPGAPLGGSSRSIRAITSCASQRTRVRSTRSAKRSDEDSRMWSGVASAAMLR